LLHAVLTLATAMVVTSHAFFFASASERRFSALELDLATVTFFFTDVLPLAGHLVMTGMIAACIGGALHFARAPWPADGALRGGSLACVVCAALALTLAPRIPSPVVDMAYDALEAATTRTVTFGPDTPLPGALSVLEGQSGPQQPVASRYSRVLVFVMETMTAAVLERERKALPGTTFVNAAPQHAHRFSAYFPSNQDSRTGMLGMLSSRFIPYEAYTEAGLEHYRFLGAQPSLVAAMQRQGYETAFAVSQNEIEIVVGDYPWQHTLSLDEADLNAARAQGLLCFVPYEFEHSCEDRALLPRVLDLIDRTPKLFLYQEFIWGHAAEYNEASGKTNTEYYSRYLDAVVDHLRAKNLLDDTLIVLTSDHGFRDTSMQGDPAVVRIPLWFYAPQFEPSADDRLWAHMDFKDLLFHELTPSLPAPPERPFTLVMGPTGSSFVRALTRAREVMQFKTRGPQHLLLRHVRLDAHDRQQRALDDQAQPASYLKLFEEYRKAFDSRAR
jgi:hypothetical protein